MTNLSIFSMRASTAKKRAFQRSFDDDEVVTGSKIIAKHAINRLVRVGDNKLEREHKKPKAFDPSNQAPSCWWQTVSYILVVQIVYIYKASTVQTRAIAKTKASSTTKKKLPREYFKKSRKRKQGRDFFQHAVP